MSARFDVEIEHNGHTLQVTGTETRYRPATGPTMDSAGGDPAEGGDLEDLAVMLLWRTKAKVWRRRALGAALVAALGGDIEDAVLEKLSDEALDSGA